MTTVDVDLPQHMRALALANRVYRARAAEKRRIKAMASRRDSLLEVVRLISFPSDELLGMPIIELLASARRMGRSTAEQWLRPPVLLRPLRRIGDLTPGEKRRIVDAILAHVPEADS